MAHERTIALAQLQTKTENPFVQHEAEALLAEPVRLVTQLDLSSLTARRRELNSDNAQLPRNTSARTARGQRGSRPAEIRKSRMKGRPTRQDPDSTPAANTRAAQVAGEDRENYPKGRSAAEPAALAQAPQQQEVTAINIIPSTSGGINEAGSPPHPSATMPAEQRQQPKLENANQASIQLVATADELENESNHTRSPEPSGVEFRVAVPETESTSSPSETTAGTTRVRFNASAKNNGLEYDPARHQLKELIRSTLTDSNKNSSNVTVNESWPSKLSVPFIETEQDQLSSDGMIFIILYIYERDQWTVNKVLLINPFDPSLLKRTVWRYKRREIFLYNMKMRTVSVSSSFRAATTDESNALLLILRQTRMQINLRQVIEPSSANIQRFKRIRQG
jgi:hypothetical protein